MLRLMFRILAILLLTLPLFGADKTAALNTFVARYHELGLFNGSVLIAEKGVPVLRKGYGEANMEWQIPNTPDTRFRLGSITKQFTATLVMQMVEKGQIDLNAPISRYLSDYPKPNGDRITIRELLNHTSGIPGYTELPDFGAKAREPSKPEEFVKTFASLQLLFEPGSRFSYSNSGYFVLGVILEKVAGKPYEDLLRERIFEPLGMKESGYDTTSALIQKRAAGYDSTLDGYRNTSYLDMTLPYSAGSLYSSVDDLLIWDQALYGDKVLSASSKQEMLTPGKSDYGYGFFIHKGPVTIVEHGGGINGFNTQIERDIESKRLYVLMNNTGGAPLRDMVRGMRSILDGKDAVMPKTPAARVLYKTWKVTGISGALEQLKSMQAGSTYDTSEGQLEQFADVLLDKGKPAEALQVASIAQVAAPKSFGVYMLLGRIQRAAGNRVEAIAAYSKAIEVSDTPRGLPYLTADIAELGNLSGKK